MKLQEFIGQESIHPRLSHVPLSVPCLAATGFRNFGLNEKLISEIHSYILAHNGPDEVQSGHPVRKQLPVRELEEAIRRANLQGRCLGIRPYHFRNTFALYNDEEYCNEVLKKKIDSLLYEEYDGDVAKLCAQVSFKDLISLYQEEIDGTVYEISLGRLGALFQGSPFKILSRYLEVKGLATEFSELRPYHLAIASKGTYKDQSVIDEVLKKKIDSLLYEKYDGNLAKLCAEVSKDDLISPLKEEIGGHVFEVSLARVGNCFQGSPFKMLTRYFELSERTDEFSELQPYHLGIASMGTYKDLSVIDRVLEKKIDELLYEKYDGNLVKFCAAVSSEELTSSFKEEVAGYVFEVSLKQVGKHFKNSPFRMLSRYFELKGLATEFSELRPYHLAKASNGAYKEQSVIDQVLKKKIDSLLYEKYDGTFSKLCAEVSKEELLSPLKEEIAGHFFEISLGAVGGYFQNSPFRMLGRYLELSGSADEFSKFRPYHLAKASNGIFDDQSVIDEVLKKKIDSLLYGKYSGSLVKFCAEVSHEDLSSPLKEEIAGHIFEVSLFRVSAHFNNCPFKMLNRYFQINGKSMSYTQACFRGSPETRLRRQAGKFSYDDLIKVRNSDGTFDTNVYGLTHFATKDKSACRELMVELAELELQDRDIHYLGLETERFESLKLIYERLQLNPAHSLVAEANLRVYNAMRSTQEALRNGEGEALRTVKIVHSTIEEALQSSTEKFNFVNLDYLGYLSPNKEFALQLLFEGDLLMDEALIFITLADRPIDRVRAENAGYSQEQDKDLRQIMQRLCGLKGFRYTHYATLPYNGGTNGKEKTQMLFSVIKVEINKSQAMLLA